VVKKTNIAVLVSGSGTNLQAIIDKAENGWLPAAVTCVISNKKDAYGLVRAEQHNIPSHFVDARGKSRQEHEKEIHEILKKYDVELVVLAGYMRLISPYLVARYKNRIINIHPALLPSFPGTDGYGDAWKYGVKVSGCTIHFVDEGCDTGPIIVQRENPVMPDDTFETFRQRGLGIEHEAYPEAIKLYCEGKLKIEGRKVRITT